MGEEIGMAGEAAHGDGSSAPSGNDAPLTQGEVAPGLSESLEVASQQGQAPPESPVAPQAPAFPSADEIARANLQTFAPMFQQLAPKPEAPRNPWDDPKQFWTVPNDPAEAHRVFHERQTEYTKYLVNEATKPLVEQIQYLHGQLQYAQARFATDPNFAKIEAKFQQYVREGVPPQHARRLADLEMGQAPPPGASPTAPRSTPIPPKHATSPATRTATPQAPARDRTKAPSIEESFARSGAARFFGGE